MDPSEISTVKEITEELLQKMTMADFEVRVGTEKNTQEDKKSQIEDIVLVNITLKEPQFLIGQNGQTLFDVQRLLRIILSKKIQKSFYLKVDINKYQAEKIEYLKNMARSLADQVAATKEKKILPPMAAYERRIIHEELSKRTDVVTESQGDGEKRYIVIGPR